MVDHTVGPCIRFVILVIAVFSFKLGHYPNTDGVLWFEALRGKDIG